MKENIRHHLSMGYTGMILAAILVLLFLLLIPSGPIRVFLLLIILFLFGLLLVQNMFFQSETVPRWERTERLDDIEHLFMPSIQVFVRGAIKGSEYSRGRVHDDIRSWFLTRIRAKRGLSDEMLTDILDSSEDLSSLVGDEIIEDFLLNGYKGPSSDGDRDRSFFSRAVISRDREYEAWLKTLLERMEAWG